MSSVEDIARVLNAPATLADAQKSYFLSNANGTLNEKTLTGAEWSLPNRVGQVKPDAPVAYAAGAPQRTVFTIGQNGTLQSYKVNSRGKWEKGGIDSANITPHVDSKLAATFANGQWHVYYQNNEGKLAEAISADDATWKSGTSLSGGSPRQGTFLQTFTDNGHYVLYQNENGCIHSQEYRDGSWADKPLSNGQLEAVKNICVTGLTEDGKFTLIYLQNDGKVKLSGPEENTELGQFGANGTFVAASSAECGRRYNIYIYGGRHRW